MSFGTVITPRANCYYFYAGLRMIYAATKLKWIPGLVFLNGSMLRVLSICNNFLAKRYKSQEEDKYQESIQSNTTPDPGHQL